MLNLPLILCLAWPVKPLGVVGRLRAMTLRPPSLARLAVVVEMSSHKNASMLDIIYLDHEGHPLIVAPGSTVVNRLSWP
jgi:hypothetical protein